MFFKLVIVLQVLSTTLGDILVEIPNGQIQGKQLTTTSNEVYYGYQGIPYAKPPTGPLRFMAPQPAEAWSGILDATKEGNYCYQVKTDSARENEDCLYVNVFTPILNATRNDTKLPVMFWIYGGAFRGGGSGFNGLGPDYFIEKGIIIVTHNYRLGPFGYLSTGDTVIPGNAGLKDQSLAIKWTYENIEYFGGDPKKITIFGESAGSASVGYQLLNKKINGMFRAAIQQSGSPLNSWAYIKDPKSYAIDLVQKIDSTTNLTDSKEILQYLQSLPASKIDAASKLTTPALTLPVVEAENPDSFITKGMYELFASGDFNQVPLIIGTNSEEEIFLIKSSAYVRQLGKAFDTTPENLVPRYFNIKENYNITEVAKEIKSIYLNDSDSFSGSLAATIKYYSDNSFNRGVIKEGLLVSQFTNVYYYLFSYDGEMGGWNKSIEGAGKVMHGEDLYYIWVRRGAHSSEDLSKYPETDVRTHKRLIQLWTNFAKYLNPTPETDDLVPVIWEKFDENLTYLDIDTDLEVKTNPKPTFKGWEEVYDNDANTPYIVY